MGEAIVLPEVWLVLVSAGIIPFLTSALTKAQSSGAKHAGVAALLSAGLVVLEQLTQDGGSFEELIVSFLVSLLTAAGAYVAAWQPVNINEKVLPDLGV